MENNFSQAELNEIKTAFEGAAAPLRKQVDDILAEMKGDREIANKNQSALDALLVKFKELESNGSASDPNKKKYLDDILREQFESKFSDLSELSKKGTEKMRWETKAVQVMTTSASLTGDGVTTGSGVLLNPSDPVNFRDLINTVRSETGLYVEYLESGGEGAPAIQATQGSAKATMDVDFTRRDRELKYIAGTLRFSRQLMKNLPFLTQVLPAILRRRFLEAENSYFASVFATEATGTVSSTETEDILQIIDALAQRGDLRFKNSYALLRFTALGRIIKRLYSTQNFNGSGTVVLDANGGLRILGTPILPVSWVPSADKIMIVDRDYINRLEAESLSIQFFEEDQDNVQKNLITARIECMEDLSISRPEAQLYYDLGNSSDS